jgi:hypothetical protein
MAGGCLHFSLNKMPKPKRKCSQKQLENLKQGREKSSLYHRLKQKEGLKAQMGFHAVKTFTIIRGNARLVSKYDIWCIFQ